MLAILSPAKIQSFKPQQITGKYTMPEYLKQAEELINLLQPLSAKQLESLLKVNKDIARNSSDSYYNWDVNHSPENAKQAILAYNGEAYRGLDANSLTETDLEYAQNHLRIISGLYGVLRPLDLIEPYRLEMATKLKNPAGKDLYAFWQQKISKSINEAIRKSGKPEVLLNLASNEYYKSIRHKDLSAKVIDFDFIESRENGYKPITVYTKKARGMMVRYILQNHIEKVEDLKGFDTEGYWYNSMLSTENKMVFARG
ncbi:peroxide stress protein YaaA [Paludibacter sp. 221]|uniref:peroxide stress protein YaaA n=1 Tax=Paludibacter sp. 221 TaxID=2302939 RepID=UPI0013D6E923|nr:peroxide stress protein YaaA [Paludibacter sp. 221]NDV45558.1 peroxide stress protein YaaA [Paludibacter sp. 221]